MERACSLHELAAISAGRGGTMLSSISATLVSGVCLSTQSILLPVSAASIAWRSDSIVVSVLPAVPSANFTLDLQASRLSRDWMNISWELADNVKVDLSQTVRDCYLYSMFALPNTFKLLHYS